MSRGKYQSRTITLTDLAHNKNGAVACSSGLNWFKRHFPTGIKLSTCQDEMNELLNGLDEPILVNLYTYFLWWSCEDSPYMWSSYDEPFYSDVRINKLLFAICNSKVLWGNK